MNCDQVFDVLTRGPFPTGTSCDEPVEQHLGECAACRRLAEALRPALELFQEAVDPEESRDLPGYWCTAADDGRHAGVSYASEVEPRTRRPLRVAAAGSLERRSAARAAGQMAAMLALGIALGSLGGMRWMLDGSAWPPADTGATVGSEAPEPQPRLYSSESFAVLPAACFGDDERLPLNLGSDPLLACIDFGNAQCCSGCHHAGSDSVPRTATAKITQSCQTCHAGSP
jgi:hypothetical protein